MSKIIDEIAKDVNSTKYDLDTEDCLRERARALVIASAAPLVFSTTPSSSASSSSSSSSSISGSSEKPACSTSEPILQGTRIPLRFSTSSSSSAGGHHSSSKSGYCFPGNQN